MTEEDKRSYELERTMANCYGTENYYTDQHLVFKYTDGVKIFCDIAEAYWLLDIVNSVVKTKPEMNKDLINITLKVKEDGTAQITFRKRIKFIHNQKIPFTDCPKGKWIFYYENNVFFWNGEY